MRNLKDRINDVRSQRGQNAGKTARNVAWLKEQLESAGVGFSFRASIDEFVISYKPNDVIFVSARSRGYKFFDLSNEQSAELGKDALLDRIAELLA